MRLLTFLICALFISPCAAFDLPDFPEYKGSQTSSKGSKSSNNDDLKPSYGSRSKKTVKPNKNRRVHYIDPYMVKRNEQYIKGKKISDKKCKNNNISKMYDCWNVYDQNFNKKLPNRGTPGFVDKYYSKLPYKEAVKKRNELVGLLRKVHYVALPDNKKIELTTGILKSEIMQLEEMVLKIEPNIY